MDNHTNMQTNPPVLQNVQPLGQISRHQTDLNEMRRRQRRFGMFGVGSILYALFYTVCLYRNASGITYPFFAGGTLLFFGYFIKKSESSSADGKQPQPKTYINKKFLMGSILAAGALNCTTDSGVLIFFNKLLMIVLFCVLLLQCWHDLCGWSTTACVKGVMTMLTGGISKMFVPASDIPACWRMSRQNRERGERNAERARLLKSVGIGLLIVTPMAMLIALLLASADEIFYELLLDILTFSVDIELLADIVRIAVVMLLVFAFVYGLFAYNMEPQNIKKIDDMARTDKINWDSGIAITINGVMCFMYVIFSGIQVVGLVFGKLPEGCTYSAYARRGFFELVIVCVFNIVLVLCTIAYFAGSRILKILLTVICGCTYIMIISSAYRMLLYISSYQLTFLRVLVLWGLLMIAVVMTGVLVCIYNQKFALLRFLLMVLTAGWLSFSAIHPDYWIASYNIAACADGQEYDSYYLRRRLSLDAVAALPPEIYRDAASIYVNRARRYERQTERFLGIRAFNFSRAYALYQIDRKE
ncbi:MAG: DUF4173 domain-containing protein [Lachnospiraceae bacterium]|nr:DUF4173 domain-containing protein [Lachnospiraceae bacterium]